MTAQASNTLVDGEADLKIDEATQLIESNLIDSAQAVSERLLCALEADSREETPTGLKAKLVYARGLELLNSDTLALPILLSVQTTSERTNEWRTYVGACRILARLYEKLLRAEDSRQQLLKAQEAIRVYELDDMHPHVAVRLASWHRVFGDPDSAAFYAQEVVTTSAHYNQKFVEAEGQLLMGIVTIADPLVAISHFEKSVNLYRSLGNYYYAAAMNLNIAQSYKRIERYTEAIAYADSAALISRLIAQEGMSYNEVSLDIDVLKDKSSIYHLSNQLDSAWHYLSLAYDKEFRYLKQRQTAQVVEISAKYNDEKNQVKLDEQAKLLKIEHQRRNLFIGTIFLILFISALLFYFNLRLRKANEETSRQAELLQQMDAAKSRFFTNISHELRTPLTLLLGPVKALLKENNLSEKQSSLLNVAERNGAQLNRLINEILDLRKLELGNMGLSLKPIRVSDFFLHYLNQFESLAEHQKVTYVINSTIDKAAVALLDREKCRQIIYNLLSNAFKFTPAGGSIQVDVGLYDGKLNFSVTDTGSGIHFADQPHVFERYFQTSQPDKPAEGGTGIGLALCREYLELFGGQIKVKSELGKGSSFRVSFPVAATFLPETEQVSSPQSEYTDSAVFTAATVTTQLDTPSFHKQAHLLLVEDNQELQDYLSLLLSPTYNLVTAANGQLAWDLLTKQENPLTVDLILSDLMMPVMDGYQLLEQLKNNDKTRHLPVIMLSARAEIEDRLKALRIGVDDYLAKPFDEEELLVRIKNLLANQAARKNMNKVISSTSIANISGEDQAWLGKFEAYVQANYASDILTIPDLAQAFSMSDSTLLRQLKRLTGLTTAKYLQEVRMDAARQLLENRTYRSVSQVATKVGYSDPRSFSRIFKSRFGKSPSDYLID